MPEPTPTPTPPAPYQPPTPPPAPVQRFNPACLNAVREFRRAKPWRGNTEERSDKFAALHIAIMRAYAIEMPLIFAPDIDQDMGDPSRFQIKDGTIIMHFKLSVVTYFTAIGVARGFDYGDALRWAFSLYCRMFPRSASLHMMRNGTVVRRVCQ